MGHTYRNIISADGASGGPQMRLGGLMENSLVIEGYWFSGTSSNDNGNPWLEAGDQSGQSAWVRNNVQLVFAYPTPNDPDTNDESDSRAQPAWGYALQGASFGAVVEGNIISGAMLEDDLGADARAQGINIVLDTESLSKDYHQKDNTIRDNIVYRMGACVRLEGDAAGASNITVENNVCAVSGGIDAAASNLTGADQVVFENNRFYSDNDLPDEPWMGNGNTVDPYADAASAEVWTDPDRTLKRYVEEVLGLTLLDWADDPRLDADQASAREGAGEAYDPMGLKTFMAVAAHMRFGGTDAVPTSGKPTIGNDYPWDERFTGLAVVNWIREGFGQPAVK